MLVVAVGDPVKKGGTVDGVFAAVTRFLIIERHGWQCAM